MATQPQIDHAKLEEFMGRAVTDMAAAESSALMYVGEKLGLYRAMTGAGPLTPGQLAERPPTNVTCGSGSTTRPRAATSRTAPTTEPASCPTSRHSCWPTTAPRSSWGLFEVVAAMWASADRVAEAFRTGEGVGWHEHDHRLFHGVERLFGPIYRGNLTARWIPALDGVEAKLRAGAKVADVGCGPTGKRRSGGTHEGRGRCRHTKRRPTGTAPSRTAKAG
jgi:hypothetical protein